MSLEARVPTLTDFPERPPEPSLTEQPWKRSLRLLLPLLVFAAAIGATVLLWQREIDNDAKRTQAALRQESVLVENAIKDRLSNVTRLLEAGRAVIALERGGSSNRWFRFVSALDLKGRYPGVVELGLASLAATERDPLERAEHLLQQTFSILPGGTNDFLIVTAPDGSAAGASIRPFDLGADPSWHLTAERARDTALVAFSETPPASPAQSRGVLHGFLAHYREGDVPPTAELRRAAVTGWIVVGLSVPQLMADVFAEHPWVALTAFDGLGLDATRVVYHSEPQLPLVPADERASAPRRSQQLSLDVGGWPLTVLVRSTPEFERALPTGWSSLVFGVGFGVSTILFILTSLLVSGASRTEVRSDNTGANKVLEQRARGLAECQSLLVLRVDPEERITFANEAAARALAPAGENLLGKPWASLFAADEADRMRAALAGVRWPPRHRFQTLARLRTADGIAPYQVEGLAVFDDKGAAVEYLIMAYESLGIGASGNGGAAPLLVAESLGDDPARAAFLAALSHDLRTPLTSIAGFSEIIGEQAFGPVGTPVYAEYARDIHTSAQELLDLVDSLLVLAEVQTRPEESELGPVAPAGLVETALERVAGKARRKGVTLSANVAPNQPPVTTDGSAAVRVAVALFAHAIAATPADGQVAVSATSRNGALEIVVCGNGVGEPSADSGPRLALVEALAELHGATLELDAAPDGTTVATVRVPGRVSVG